MTPARLTAAAMESTIALLALFSSFHLLVGPTNAKLPGMLFPRDSESREVKDLSGFWNFRADMSENRNAGFEQSWFAKPLWQVRNLNYFSYSLQQPGIDKIPKKSDFRSFTFFSRSLR